MLLDKPCLHSGRWGFNEIWGKIVLDFIEKSLKIGNIA
jgi:hypothetical protein